VTEESKEFKDDVGERDAGGDESDLEELDPCTTYMDV
jgi:hypothetical protein